MKERRRKIVRNCKDLDKEYISVTTFMHNIVAMNLPLFTQVIDFQPSTDEIEYWGQDDFDMEDGFIIGEKTIYVGQAIAEHSEKDSLSEKTNSQQKKVCVSCEANPPGAVFDKCGHNVVCTECVMLFQGDDALTNECPVCYKVYTNVIIIQ